MRDILTPEEAMEESSQRLTPEQWYARFRAKAPLFSTPFEARAATRMAAELYQQGYSVTRAVKEVIRLPGEFQTILDAAPAAKELVN